jgi:hypothetical protein
LACYIDVELEFLAGLQIFSDSIPALDVGYADIETIGDPI